MGYEHRSDSQQMDDRNDPKAPRPPKFQGKPLPEPYNLDDTGEVYRLLMECHGYLKTCHYKHGTDWKGRQYAMDALDELLKRDWKMVPNPPGP